ncbi:MAG: hypothetical protein ABW118_10405 [Candidatus Thiodiazotropha sp.]
MDWHRFDAEVRPYLIEIPVGSTGIAFDRHELVAWADWYKHRFGHQPRKEIDVGIFEGENLGTIAGEGLSTSILNEGAGKKSQSGLEKARELLARAR